MTPVIYRDNTYRLIEMLENRASESFLRPPTQCKDKSCTLDHYFVEFTQEDKKMILEYLSKYSRILTRFTDVNMPEDTPHIIKLIATAAQGGGLLRHLVLLASGTHAHSGHIYDATGKLRVFVEQEAEELEKLDIQYLMSAAAKEKEV